MIRGKKARTSVRYRFNRAQKPSCVPRGTRPPLDPNARFPFSGYKSKCRRFDRTPARFLPPAPTLHPNTVFHARGKVNNDRSSSPAAMGDIKNLGLKKFQHPRSILFLPPPCLPLSSPPPNPWPQGTMKTWAITWN